MEFRSEKKAERVVKAAALREQRWKEPDLVKRWKSDPFKGKLRSKLR